jgi:preprotein translocase subunit SecA
MSESALLGLLPRELAHGRPYVEREEHQPPWHDEVALWLWHHVARPLWCATGGDARAARAVVAATRAAGAGLDRLEDAALRAQARALRTELRLSGFGGGGRGGGRLALF